MYDVWTYDIAFLYMSYYAWVWLALKWKIILGLQDSKCFEIKNSASVKILFENESFSAIIIQFHYL